MNLNKVLLIIIGILVAVFAVVLIQQKNAHDEQLRQYEKQIQADFDRRQREFDKGRDLIQHQRDSAIEAFNNLAHRYDSLDSITNALERDISKIPGSFKGLSNKQLEQKMIEEYEKNRK